MRPEQASAQHSTMNDNENANAVSDSNVDVISSMYAALGRADVDAIVAALDEDVDWISVSEEGDSVVPWYGRYRGKADVPRFFQGIGANVDITEFVPLSFTSNATDVMVSIRWAFTVRATGKSATLHMQHWFRLTDGKVTFVRTAEDSERTAAAFS
jgi:ketosteroid isomerase-like protein